MSIVGMWPIMRRGLSTVTPFTYRDGATYLELLNAIKESVKELVGWVTEAGDEIDALYARIAEVEKSADRKIAEGLKAIRDDNEKFRAELLKLVGEISTGGASFNPTNGTTHEPISKVISDVYDYVRVHAMFAADMDVLDMTAAQLDARSWSARHHDLSPLDPTNDELEN